MFKKIVLGASLIAMLCGCGHYEHHYTRKSCEVIQINDGFVTVYDETGEAWDFKGDDFVVGEKVDLKMYDNNTSNNIYDDEIIEVIKR